MKDIPSSHNHEERGDAWMAFSIGFVLGLRLA